MEIRKRRWEQRIFSWELGSYLEPIGLLFHMGQKEPIGERRPTQLKCQCGVQVEEREIKGHLPRRPKSPVR